MRRLLVVAAAALAVVAAACSGGSKSHASHPPVVRIRVAQPGSLADSVDPISVTGLKPGVVVTLTATTTDMNHQALSSSATFRAGRNGTVDVATQPPVSGTYSGIQPMGLLTTLQPKSPYNASPYDDAVQPVGQAVTVRATVAGQQVATTTLTRRLVAPG